MRVKSSQLTKSYSTLTDPAAKTKRVGLPADASGVMVFASRQFHHDPKFTYIPGACKNHATATLTATQLNRRAVSLKLLALCHIDRFLDSCSKERHAR